MLHIYASDICLTCMPYICASHICLTYMPQIYASHICLTFASHTQNSLWHSTLFFTILPQVKDNVELFPSSSRSFYMFFYSWNVSIELTSLLFPVFLRTTCRLPSDCWFALFVFAGICLPSVHFLLFCHSFV